jgi:hypothetical protein
MKLTYGMMYIKQHNKINSSSLIFTIILLCIVHETTSYFSTQQSKRRCRTISTNIDTTTSCNFGRKKPMLKLQISDLPYDDGSGLSYAERIRPYRRDVFDSDEWIRIRSTTRFSTNLLGLFQSGVVRQLLTVQEAILILSVATFVCLYNALLVIGYEDFSGIHHDPLLQDFYELSLPSVLFTLTSPALSLLLRM